MSLQVTKAAHAKFLRIGDRKLRQVARLIKGLSAELALDQLNFMAKRKLATAVAKTLKSAVANAIESDTGSARLRPEDLTVSGVRVDSGPIAKRMEFRAMGRANRIQKRYCHLTVEVTGQAHEHEAVPRGKAKKSVKKTVRKPAIKKGAARKVAEPGKSKPARKTAAKKAAAKKGAATGTTVKKTAAKKTASKTTSKSAAKAPAKKTASETESGKSKTGLGTKRTQESD